MGRCPICDRVVKPRAENPSFPFCTSRCKTVDLGNWVNEEYRISTVTTPETDDVARSRDNEDSKDSEEG